MKVFRKTNECVSSYNKSTKGFEFVGDVETLKEMYDLVASLECSDFYPQEDGTVLSADGNEVYDPKYQGTFDFGDYIYCYYNEDDLDEYTDAHIIRAINEN